MGTRAYILRKYHIEYGKSLPSFKNDKNALYEALDEHSINFYDNDFNFIIEIEIKSLKRAKAKGKYAQDIKLMQEAVKSIDFYKDQEYLYIEFA